jgi:hypothetical protein
MRDACVLILLASIANRSTSFANVSSMSSCESAASSSDSQQPQRLRRRSPFRPPNKITVCRVLISGLSSRTLKGRRNRYARRNALLAALRGGARGIFDDCSFFGLPLRKSFGLHYGHEVKNMSVNFAGLVRQKLSAHLPRPAARPQFGPLNYAAFCHPPLRNKNGFCGGFVKAVRG